MNQYWIFGYGSLMWNPGFQYVSRCEAQIEGFHRSLCVYSVHHRGTAERPGLVLGLDDGGTCRGVAFEIAPDKWDETLSYLRAREQISMVYREISQPIELIETKQKTEAVVFVADRNHAQYAGKLSHQELLRHVLQGEGQYGRCIDYVMSTLSHLRGMSIHDEGLEALGRELSSLSGQAL